MPLAKAAYYWAYAAASLANAEAAVDRTDRDVHLVLAQHFCLLAEHEINRVRQPCSGSGQLDRSFAHVSTAMKHLRTIAHPHDLPEIQIIYCAPCEQVETVMLKRAA